MTPSEIGRADSCNALCSIDWNTSQGQKVGLNLCYPVHELFVGWFEGFFLLFGLHC